jgi:hypothetical protein
MAFSRSARKWRPLTIVYDEIAAFLDPDREFDNSERKKSFEAMRKKIFGDHNTKDFPYAFSEMSLVKELNIPYSVWKNDYSVDDKARVYAVRAVRNMADVIDAYYREVDAALEKLRNKQASDG